MMPGVQLSDLARAVDAVLQGEDAPVYSVGIDSRRCKTGQLFVALRGQHTDGHAYLAEVQRAGACGAIVEELQACDLAQIAVDSSARALATIAAFNRERFDGRVVGVTGSAGKTACKNMLASIFSRKYALHATRGNFNNELGLPLTLLELNDSHEFAVLEMGAAKPGDIAYLAALAKPHVALVTNVSEAHLGGFGSLEITARTKGELFDSLPGDGIAVMNRDDAFFDYWRQRFLSGHAEGSIWSFSLHNSAADCYAVDLAGLGHGSRFEVRSARLAPDWSLEVTLPLPGRHNVANALACVALCKSIGVDDESIRLGLADVQSEAHRLQACVGAANELRLYDDSYNASPASMEAALETVASLHRSRPDYSNAPGSVAVFGDMAELGELSARLHRQTGRRAAELGFDHLFATGAHAEDYLAGFRDAGGKNYLAGEMDSLVQKLRQPELRGATVLVKGSRVAGMDALVEALQLSAPAEASQC